MWLHDSVMGVARIPREINVWKTKGKLRGVVVVRMRCGWLVVGVLEHERRVRYVRSVITGTTGVGSFPHRHRSRSSILSLKGSRGLGVLELTTGGMGR